MFYNENRNGGQASNLFPGLWATQEELDRATTSCLSRVFLRMFVALLVTAAAALAVVSSEALMALIYGNPYAVFVLLIAQVVLVIAISAGINRLSPAVASVLFIVYAIMNGLTLSVIFLVYELGIIYHAFGVSALMFAGMALYGTITRKNLSSIGSLCIMGLFGIIIASIANMLFFRSATLETAVLYIGVLVFVGLTAYDTQRIKWMLREAHATSHAEAIRKISVIGALSLYLNFINLFLRILRILGRRR
jgi:hypothetical protein